MSTVEDLGKGLKETSEKFDRYYGFDTSMVSYDGLGGFSSFLMHKRNVVEIIQVRI